MIKAATAPPTRYPPGATAPKIANARFFFHCSFHPFANKAAAFGISMEGPIPENARKISKQTGFGANPAAKLQIASQSQPITNMFLKP